MFEPVFFHLRQLLFVTLLVVFRFPLGTRGNVDKYIKQFTEIFTEEGRRAVRITHQVPGQKPTVTCTQPPQNASSAPAVTTAQQGSSGALTGVQAQSLITQATNLAASLAAGQVSWQTLRLVLSVVNEVHFS